MSDTPKTDAVACDGWSGDACCVSYEFAQEQERRINELENALRPFALAHGHAAAYVRTFELAKPMDRRDLFMWQSNRPLCVDDYVAAAKAYGGQTMFGL